MSPWVWVVLGVIVAAPLIAWLLLGWLFAAAGSAGQSDVDYRRDADGRVVLLDTEKARAASAMAYDANVAFELSGHVMSNGMSWNDTWLQTIRHLRTGGRQDNGAWYVDYIVRARREAGLPDLVGLDALPEERAENP